jgi:ubiquinone/menaquinone biosynthesis C-methylase UbiE
MKWEKEWDEFYKDGRYIMWYPSESVIRFMSFITKDKQYSVNRILDVGCGNGRHIIYLAREGFQVYGIDISQESINIALKWAEKEKICAELRKGCATAIPYPDEYFNVIICFGVLDHLVMDDAEIAIHEMNRVLTPGGWLFLSLRSTRDTDCGRGKEIEHNTFLLTGDVEEGLPQHFFEGEELKKLLSEFNTEYIECEERLYGDSLSYIYSRWIVAAKKP